MWAGMEKNSTSLVVDPNLGEQLFRPVQQRNVSVAAASCPSCLEEPLTRSGGIIPGAIAATVFIVFLLGLYALLWKCMSQPPRRKSKMRTRVQQKTPV